MANLYAIDFEASSTQFAAIGDGSQTGLDLSGNHTIEAWVNIESLPSNGTYRILVAKHGPSGSFGYFWGIYNNAGTYELRGGWSSNGSNFDTHSYSLGTFNTATYYHVAIAVTISTHTAEFYKNAVSLGTDATGTLTSINNNNQTFYVGALDQGGGSGYYDGLLDELRVWNVTRTANQIAQNLYRDVTGQTGLQAYWKFENGYTDSSGNSNTLTPNNSPTFVTTPPFPNYVTDGGQFIFNLL